MSPIYISILWRSKRYPRYSTSRSVRLVRGSRLPSPASLELYALGEHMMAIAGMPKIAKSTPGMKPLITDMNPITKPCQAR